MNESESESESEMIDPANSSLNFTSPMQAIDVLDSVFLRVAVIFAYSAVFVLGISGNLGIIFTVYRKRSMRTTVNILVANLAWSDICTCVISNTFTPINVFSGWPLGNSMCRFLPMLSSSSIFVSSLTSTLIAVDRYLAVHALHKKLFTYQRLSISIALIWTISILFSLPISVFSEVTLNQCSERWPPELHTVRKYYTWTCFSIQFIVPSIIVMFSYLRVIRTLNSRLQHNLKKGWSVLARKRISRIEATWRINKMLMLMVVSFMICYLPMNVFNVMVELAYSYMIHLDRYILIVYLSVHWIAMSSTIYNPLLCITFNNDFRPRCLRRQNAGDSKTAQGMSFV